MTAEAAAVLFYYEGRGFTFKRKGPFLEYGPVSELTKDDHAIIRQHVDEILPLVDAFAYAVRDRKRYVH